jgi:hypothetical protein
MQQRRRAPLSSSSALFLPCLMILHAVTITPSPDIRKYREKA